jgi:fructose-bisphosphate aldolase class I
MAGSTLKPNIVNPGKNCPVSYTVEEIAEANVFVFEQSFPVAMKGCNYLSGGQDLAAAAARLSAINKANTKGPWNLVRSRRLLVSILLLSLLFFGSNNSLTSSCPILICLNIVFLLEPGPSTSVVGSL